MILILGTGLTSWLLPGEGTTNNDHHIVLRATFIDSVMIVMIIHDDDNERAGLHNDFEERKRRGDGGQRVV